MSIEDEYNAAEGKSDEFRAKTEFDGSDGYIQTAGVDESFDPTDVDGILKKFGYDPDKVELVGDPRVSRWEQFSTKPGSRGSRWLSAYRFHIRPKSISVDLPALYAEVAKTKPKPLKAKTGESTVVVCWADIQTGKVDHLGGIQELLTRLTEKRAALDDYLKRANFDHIVVADVGDIVEGFDNFPAQHRTNALSLMDQVDVAATEFWLTLKLCERHAPVDVLSIPSNHCQWRKGGKTLAGKTTDDWGLYISKQLEKQNNELAERGVELRLNFHRPEDWNEALQFNVRGTRLGLAHGHQANNPDQVKTWWTKMTHAGVLDCDILLTGHYHFASLRPSGKNPVTNRSKWHIQAPTLDNGSSWVRNKFGEDGDPALAVFQINDGGFDVQSFALL